MTPGHHAAVRPRRIAASVWLPAALLFGSGFCALVYQVLWLRLLGLVFGVTVHAAGTVLAGSWADWRSEALSRAGSPTV